jgi:hypothetical protein
MRMAVAYGNYGMTAIEIQIFRTRSIIDINILCLYRADFIERVNVK